MMPNTLSAVEPGLYWLQIPSGEWVRAYTDGERLWRLAPVGDGLPLADVLGALAGPLREPGRKG
jgi:hypothetical protein